MANHSKVTKDKKDGAVVCRINTRTCRGTYYIRQGSGQSKFLETVDLVGFDKLPPGFKRSGYGMTGSGPFLLDQLAKKYGRRLALRIKATGKTCVNRSTSSTRVDIPLADLKGLNKQARDINAEKNARTRALVEGYLATALPTAFSKGAAKQPEYKAGTVATLLALPSVATGLSKEDRDSLAAFYGTFLKGVDVSVKSVDGARFILDNVQAGQRVFLKRVIADYEKKLDQPNLTEPAWQTFLRENILYLLNSYTAVVEKQSVDLDGKYPDFMLIDPYGYLDIYEIKKPHTSLLKYDDSRKNYYWDVELSKAIAQVERYIDGTREHRLDVAEKIKTSTGREIQVVRPRGFIIAGRRSQLDSSEAERGFRILNDSLKNIDVILYDDLLANVKTLVARLSKQTGRVLKSKKVKKKGKP